MALLRASNGTGISKKNLLGSNIVNKKIDFTPVGILKILYRRLRESTTAHGFLLVLVR